ncbi:MAG TPA: prolyl oligopeptidase family serine peptidase [Acidimicrobiales bacterium]|nr:prolyl oligopeptidase family serine peptidase [Acidimicrobiales bacterium]
MTPPAPSGESHRYADARRIPGCEWLVALRERHHPGGVDDQIVAVPARETGPVVVLLAGRDFYAAPRPSPSGRHLAWLCWDHPNMPWDGCELWIADLDGPRLNARLLLAGGVTESVGQPTWSPDGRLWFTSDRAGWWQPYRTASFEKDAGPSSDAHRRQTERVCGEEAEFHSPDWVLGQKTFDFLSDGTLIARMRRSGVDQIVAVDATSGEVAVVPQPCVTISSLAVARLSNSVPAARSASEEVGLGDELVVVLGATPDQPAGIYEVQATRAVAAIGVVQTTYGPRTRTGATASEKAAEDLVRYFHLRSPTKAPLDANRVSRSRPMDFETVGGVKAHLLYFEPVDAFSEAAEKPPLVVWCHGGPTGAVEPGFDAGIQFWTSRGIAVAAVDYRGSAGYGRAYRELLTGLWGVADAEDCAAAARFLVGEGFCDGGRVAIRGASAGGLTALRAATPGGPFAAAVVAYGVSDLRTLAQDTHKFESRYLDGLVGPWPEAAEIYDERSPARHPEWVGVPVLLLQGSEDPVVPPSQASRLANSLRARGIRCDHVVFEGEGHGFRRAETLAQAARAELAFLGEVLGLASLS